MNHQSGTSLLRQYPEWASSLVPQSHLLAKQGLAGRFTGQLLASHIQAVSPVLGDKHPSNYTLENGKISTDGSALMTGGFVHPGTQPASTKNGLGHSPS